MTPVLSVLILALELRCIVELEILVVMELTGTISSSTPVTASSYKSGLVAELMGGIIIENRLLQGLAFKTSRKCNALMTMYCMRGVVLTNAREARPLINFPRSFFWLKRYEQRRNNQLEGKGRSERKDDAV